MDFLTRIITKFYSQVFILMFLFIGFGASAQNNGKLTLKGEILCDKKDKKVMSSVTVYRYYHLSKSVELMEQQMIPRNGSFSVNVEFDKDYIIDVASNTGVHKRVHLNTEVMKGYKYDNQKYEFAVDVQKGNTDKPEEVAWIYYDPSKNDFDFTNQMPMAFEGR
ncbi:MAG: hypothetical protein K9J17_04870 [Flavobacteriales bacterium]|nr:hypothetical protein [Flavobacteriales bacterium]